MLPLLRLSHLYFRYTAAPWLRITHRSPASWVLADINCQIQPGEIVAITGANGVGKSTLLRLMAGLLIPSRGTVRIEEQDLARIARQQRRQIAWQGNGERSFSWRLTGRQNLHFFAALRGIDARTCEQRLAELEPVLGLTAVLDQRLDRTSHGQKQRLAWARLLLARPALLLLDEPFLGLDDVGRQQIWQLLATWWPRHSSPTLIIATPQPDPTIPWSQLIQLLPLAKGEVDAMAVRSRE